MSLVLILALAMPLRAIPTVQEQTTVLTCANEQDANQFRRRPDFLSATPTYGPEGLWIVVLKGRPNLTARRPAPPNRIGNP